MKSKIQIAMYIFWVLSLAFTISVALHFKNKFEVSEKKSAILLGASQEISQSLLASIEATSHAMKASTEQLKAITIFWTIREKEKFQMDPLSIGEIYASQLIAKTEMENANQCISKIRAGPEKLTMMGQKLNELSGKQN